jgi:hypothetical protein
MLQHDQAATLHVVFLISLSFSTSSRTNQSLTVAAPVSRQSCAKVCKMDIAIAANLSGNGST